MLDPRYGPGLQVARQAGPVEVAVVRQPQGQAAVGHQPVSRAPTGPQLRRRGPEDVLAGPLQLAHAAEPGREGHLHGRQVGVVEQTAGEVGPPRPGQAVRGHTELGEEQTPEMAAGNAEPRRQLALGVAVEGAIGDQLHGPAHQLRTGP